MLSKGSIVMTRVARCDAGTQGQVAAPTCRARRPRRIRLQRLQRVLVIQA